MALPLRTRMAARAGQAVAAVSRRARAGEGAVIGGIVLLRVDPRALERYAAGPSGCLVSGTHGETTTTPAPGAGPLNPGPGAPNLTGGQPFGRLGGTPVGGP